MRHHTIASGNSGYVESIRNVAPESEEMRAKDRFLALGCQCSERTADRMQVVITAHD